MCIAVPGKILSVEGNTAEVDFSGARRKVALDLLAEAKKGDFVLVHAGFAITLLEQSEAEKTLELFKEIYGHQEPAKR